MIDSCDIYDKPIFAGDPSSYLLDFWEIKIGGFFKW